MRRLIPVLIAILGACYADGPAFDQSIDPLTKQECDDLGDPYAGCPAFTPTAAACAGPSAGKKWNPNWTNGKPICLGFGKDIDDCDCNRLDVPPADYDKCLNERFIKCGEAGLLPGQAPIPQGQTVAADMCFVTARDKVKCEYLPKDGDGDPRWPDNPGEKDAPTTREMCELGPPDPASVKACRKKASCGAKGKKVGCTCVPCDVYALTDEVGAGTGSGSGGDACIDDCAFEVAADPACAVEPVCSPTPTPSPTISPTPWPSATPTPWPTISPTPWPSATPTPSPTISPTPWPSATP